MNALNILSGISSTPPPSPPRSRTSSTGNIASTRRSSRGGPVDVSAVFSSPKLSGNHDEDYASSAASDTEAEIKAEETVPLLGQDGPEPMQAPAQKSALWRVPKWVAGAIVAVFALLISTLMAPVSYIVSCFRDEQGNFSVLVPLRRIDRLLSKKRRSNAYATKPGSIDSEKEAFLQNTRVRPRSSEDDSCDAGPRSLHARGSSIDSSTTAISDSEPEKQDPTDTEDGPARNTRSKTGSLSPSSAGTPQKKSSIRIKLHSEEGPKRKRQRKSASPSSEEDKVATVANSLKSPSSPAAATKLKYPHAPRPPRPLVPKRQPSYTLTYNNSEPPKKTLIIDLDETLIHSMAKGGRMSTGHMVEVKFQVPIGGNGVVLGPQVPILYYVHERPYCHDFLRKVCKWYNLIVFTASVQEYADPVIDWLERERKYFSGRYYRQHCTLRNGAYIKDLSQVEPDLSKVMILDNSPMSYIFHEDNAIPIEGWISDPTDNDLLHLIPLLEGLQYVTDVRALLALRLGQAERA